MCEALRDLLKDDFEAAEARGEVRGEERGEIKGAIRTYRDEMDLTPTEIIDRIMNRYPLEREKAEEYVRETLGLGLELA